MSNEIILNFNILLAGVGGQGLVLTTKLICDSAFFAGFDFKSNDVIGLSQRGGKVWGSVKIGEKIFSPNIAPKQADFLLALEPLEGLRWSHMLKENSTIIINESIIPPVDVIFEKEVYPPNISSSLKSNFNVISINANIEGQKIGSSKVANAFLLGILAKKIPEIKIECWKKSIEENVPQKTVELNLKAFNIGFNFN